MTSQDLPETDPHTIELLEALPSTVRELVDAQYAALAIMNEEGRIIHFFFAGISEEEAVSVGDLPHGHGLLGFLNNNGKTIRVSHMGAHPSSTGFPKNHPVMISFLGVPIIRAGRNYGNLYLTNKQGAEEFTHRDQKIVEVMAEYIALAIENDRLFRAEYRLREQANFQTQSLNTMIDNVPVGILVASMPGAAIIFSNDEIKNIFNSSFEIGDKIDFSDDDITWMHEDGTSLPVNTDPLSASISAKQELRDQIMVIDRENPSQTILSVDAVPIQQIDQTVLLIVINDITHIHEVEKLKNEFLSMVTHDLRGPLATIRSLTQTLNHQVSPSEQYTTTQALSEEAENMSDLVDNLLNMARIESGAIPFDPESCHIIDIAEECKRQFERSRYGTSHRLHLEIHENTPFFYADHLLVLRLLNNLVSNAAKYSPVSRDIWLKASPMKSNAKNIVVEVVDRGIGIPKSEQANIFDKFYRLATSQQNGKPGAGLGLAICQYICKLHGSILTVQSKVGEGTVFKCSFPSIG